MKAGFTVEAVFICPLICLFLCGMISLTLQFYGQIESYSCMLLERELPGPAAGLLRVEAFIEEVVQEVETNAGGV